MNSKTALFPYLNLTKNRTKIFFAEFEKKYDYVKDSRDHIA